MASIENTKQALAELQEEELSELYEIIDGMEILENMINRYSNNLKDVKESVGKLELLTEIKDNILTNLHLYLPICEIIAILLTILSLVFVPYSSIWLIILLAFILITTIDIGYLNENIFKKVSNEKGIFNRMFQVLRNCMKPQKRLSKELGELQTSLIKINGDLIRTRKEYSDLEERKQQIIIELSKLESSINELEVRDIVVPETTFMLPGSNTVVELTLAKKH